jgi:hypothetical protein
MGAGACANDAQPDARKNESTRKALAADIMSIPQVEQSLKRWPLVRRGDERFLRTGLHINLTRLKVHAKFVEWYSA